MRSYLFRPMKLARYLIALVLVTFALRAEASHTRIFAVVLANEEPGTFTGASSIGSGLWQSDDSGRTWKQLGWNHLKAFSMDAVMSTNCRTLYIASGNGVMKSTDAGENWTIMTDWRVAEALDIAVDQVNPANIYIATAHGIWKSTDAGRQWKRSGKGIPIPYCSRIKIDRENSLRLVAAAESGLYVSYNGANSWKRAFGPLAPVRDVYQSLDGGWIGVSEGLGIIHAAQDARALEVVDTTSSELWAVSNVNHLVVGGPTGVKLVSQPSVSTLEPRDVNSLLEVGKTIYAGTMGNGVWKRDAVVTDSTAFKFAGLKASQVWTLRAFEVE